MHWNRVPLVIAVLVAAVGCATSIDPLGRFSDAGPENGGAPSAGGPSAGSFPGLGGSSSTGGDPSSGGTAGISGSGGAMPASCANKACVDVFDCVFVYLGNSCGYTACTGGICK
jgi:hypothetical protein